MTPSPARRVLLVRSGERVCAIAIEHVVETLRPLRAEPLSGAPPFVTGVAVLRGEPVPVVDLAVFLSGAASPRVTRWVALRCGARVAVLAVDAVVGVGDLAGDAPVPLLAGACGGALESLAALDRELLVVLEAGRVVSGATGDAPVGPEAAP